MAARALWICAAVGLGALAPASAAGAACQGEGARCTVEEEGISLLQVQKPGGPMPQGQADEVHCVFTVDCRPFNLWQAEVMFLSALRVGQRGPITEIVSGCSAEMERNITRRHRSLGLPAHFRVHFVQTFNDEKSIWLSKPYGVQQWYRTAGPERDVIAVLDPDFVFLRPLTAEIDGASAVLQWPGKVPKKVTKGVVASQRYALVYPVADKGNELFHLSSHVDGMTDANLLTYVCSGSTTGKSGCTNVTRQEIGFYHSVGVPYIAHRDDWEWLVDDWADVTRRLHEHSPKGYYVDMWSWILANAHRKQRQVVLHNLMVTGGGAGPPQSEYEAWEAIDALGVDPCHSSLDEVLPPGSMAQLPHFIHYCAPMPMFSKYWFDWDGNKGPHFLERCSEGNTSYGLRQITDDVPTMSAAQLAANVTEKRRRFYGCTMRSFVKEVVQHLCAGQANAAFVERGRREADVHAMA